MQKTILVVDDDSDSRRIYGLALAEFGYRVITAKHGAEGVHLARKLRPQLILMDIRMPVMDGLHAMTYLRSDPETRPIPVWAMSAYLEEDSIMEMPEMAGFHRLIRKPITPNEVVDSVANFLGVPRKLHPHPD